MEEQARIAVGDLAEELGVRKQHLFKVIKRLGIRTAARRDASSGNQMVATVGARDVDMLRSEVLRTARQSSMAGDASLEPAIVLSPDEAGMFYVIALEPELDPGRFKAGFTTDADARLRKHRCSAPFATYLGTWGCRRAWERAAIACITVGCTQLHTEVFRADCLEGVVERARAFFAMMPATSDGTDKEPT